jgi:transketolase
MSSKPFDATDQLCVNTLRTLAIDMVEAASSGHPGLPMGAAPMAYVLWQRHLRFDPENPERQDRDRFVLSAGHGSALLYALLHVYGFPLPVEELRRFRQWESLTPGHPEATLTTGVEATTGPLGQGSAIAVGMAIAERALAARRSEAGRNDLAHTIYALVSDGDLMEGMSAEASSLAGHMGLGNLIYLYDSNDVSLDGPTSMAFTEDVAARYAAYGWHVQRVSDGNTDFTALDEAISEARTVTDRPSLIVVETTIGYGSPGKAGTSSAHGSPLGADEANRAKQGYGWPGTEPFHVPDAARARFAEGVARAGTELGPVDEADRDAGSLELPSGWDDDLPTFEIGDALATRAAAGKALNALAKRIPWLIGGDADLSGSTKTALADEEDFSHARPSGRNLRFGVREHAMGAIANGIAYHGGLRPYTATFLAFSDYMRTPIRLAALDRLPSVFVFTHDSIGVGEDGPTHQPIEHVTSLRAIPGLRVFRPGDPNEASACWRTIVADADAGPAALILSRQGMPVLEGTATLAREGVARGGYVLRDASEGIPQILLIATGSELHLATGAAAALEDEGIRARVVSMPCRELFDAQDQRYRDDVLPPDVLPRIAVEAGITMGWHAYVGPRGAVVGIDRFGASAPGGELMENFGFTVQRVVETARAIIDEKHARR